jgi:hypothetical protein
LPGSQVFSPEDLLARAIQVVQARGLAVSARFLLVCAVLAVLGPADPARAQFTDPRTYENTPVGTNQVELGYAYARADTSIDTSLVITGAQLVLHQGTVGYTRYFGWLHRLMWVEAAVPFASLGGSISGTNVQGSIAGAGDSSYAVSMLLKGGPALGEAQFQHYTPRTTLGVSVAVTAPTGSYDSARLLNLGADRWSFKPEIGLSHPFGPDHKWVLDVNGNVYWYTDNTSYRGRELLRQEPLVGLEGHISYAFSDRVWTSFDARYSGRAATVIDGVNQDNPQRNVVVGSETNISLRASSSLMVGFAKAVAHRNGPSVAGVSVKFNYTWGRGGT